MCNGFDDDHFKLSVDPMRVMTFPDSINGETGLLCKSLGGRGNFESMSISSMLVEARLARIYNYPIRWYNLGLEDFMRSYQRLEEPLHSHPEPRRGR
ncbi:MAG: hypothetical protein NTY03_07425 [Candidatus Bathyarchaeota archaeon]|nr:hypothetical protein [Candidatus Bathyarchaeota archaeon]